MKEIVYTLFIACVIITCSCTAKTKSKNIIVSKVEWRGKQLTFTNRINDLDYLYHNYKIDKSGKKVFNEKDKKIRIFFDVPEKKYDFNKYGGIELFVTFYNNTDKIQKYYYGKWITNDQYIGSLYGISFVFYSSDYLSHKIYYDLPLEISICKYIINVNNSNIQRRFPYYPYYPYYLKYYKDGFIILNPGEHKTYMVRFTGKYMDKYVITKKYYKYRIHALSDYSKCDFRLINHDIIHPYLQDNSNHGEYFIISDAEIMYINMIMPR